MSAVTIGDIQGALCGPALSALTAERSEFTTLLAALDAAKDVDVGPLPNPPLVLVAPTDTAFAAALEALNVTAADLLKDTDTLASILSVHVAGAANDEATTATDLSKSSLVFMVDGKAAPLASTWPTNDEQVPGVKVMGPVNTADVAQVISCESENQTVFVTESVLLPTSLGPEPSPPGSATVTSMMASAGALVLGALQFL